MRRGRANEGVLETPASKRRLKLAEDTIARLKAQLAQAQDHTRAIAIVADTIARLEEVAPTPNSVVCELPADLVETAAASEEALRLAAEQTIGLTVVEKNGIKTLAIRVPERFRMTLGNAKLLSSIHIKSLKQGTPKWRRF